MSGPLLVGIDPSLTGTGIALPTGVAQTIKPPLRLKGYARHWFITSAVLRYATGQVEGIPAADVVAIEGYALHAPHRLALIRIAELGGMIRAGLDHAGITFVELPPSTVKRYATGNGAAKKAQMIEAALAEGAHLVDPTDDNQADAWWCRRAAFDHYANPRPHPDLTKVDWPDL